MVALRSADLSAAFTAAKQQPTNTMTTTTKTSKTRKAYEGPTAEEKLCSALVELVTDTLDAIEAQLKTERGA